MLLISLSGMLEYLVENMAKLKVETQEGFKENRIQGDELEERLKTLETKFNEVNVALTKTTRFDERIQNDSMAVLTRVSERMSNLENIFVSKVNKDDVNEKVTPAIVNKVKPKKKLTIKKRLLFKIHRKQMY